MEKRKLGKSDIELSVFGIGCWSYGGKKEDYWGAQDQSDAEAVVHAALDRGINYFDTAEAYNDGRSEEALGKALGGRRDEAIIGAKIPPEHTEPQTLREHCEASLRRLGTDCIDVYMIHWPITDHSTDDAFAAMKDLQAEGKIRVIGVSNFGVEQLGEAMDTGVRFDVNQLCYNLFSRGIEDGIMPMCAEHEIGIIGYMPLLQGLLADKFKTPDEIPEVRARTRHFDGSRPQSRHGEAGAEAEVFAALDGIREIARELGMPMSRIALRWCIERREMTCVIAGVRNLEQLDDNIAAFSHSLPADAVRKLNELTDPVMEKIGTNADYFEGRGNSRIR
ncbi:MAG: aldo/keto reductase [Planctomycetes bacterium]|nr:aldo/keto reductase [Planctomycetota bacterium]